MEKQDAIVLAEMRSISKDLSGSKLIPTPLQGKPSDVLAIVFAGRELGFGPMQSMRAFDVIQGKLSMTSSCIGALIQGSPACEYLTVVESSAKIATYETKRRGSPAPVRMSFTIDEAKQAGLTNKDNYKKNPVAMLLARCQARVGRAVYPDLLLGVYDRDSGEIVESEVTARSESAPTAQATHAAQVASALKSQVAPAKVEDIVDAEVVETDATPEADEPGAPDGIDETVAELKAKIEAATGLDTLQAIAKTIPQTLPDDVKIVLREAYFARRTALVGGAS